MNTLSIEKKPVQIDLPVAFVAEIDRLAAEEMISRSAWVRRLLHGAVKAARAAHVVAE
jgi:metal-responsive CopG/Arc/MetJ family transcriptional regulator